MSTIGYGFKNFAVSAVEIGKKSEIQSAAAAAGQADLNSAKGQPEAESRSLNDGMCPTRVLIFAKSCG